jgi:hypothetical protein
MFKRKLFSTEIKGVVGMNQHTGTKFRLQKKSLGMHLNKFQAVLCVAVSAALSIGLIIWGVEAFI